MHTHTHMHMHMRMRMRMRMGMYMLHAHVPLQLDEADFGSLTATAARLADECCGGRLVSLLEGGYNLEALSRRVGWSKA